MDSETFSVFKLFGAIALVIVIIVVLVMGPRAVQRSVSAWYASGYGADWLIVHYSVDGSIINFWELKNGSVDSETNSDGIYFLHEGNVIHICGSYAYIQVDNWDTARKNFLAGRFLTKRSNTASPAEAAP